MKTPIQKRIAELTETKERHYNDKNYEGYNKCGLIIDQLQMLLPDEEEALTSAYNDGVMHPESYDEQWFENTYNGKDE